MMVVATGGPSTLAGFDMLGRSTRHRETSIFINPLEQCLVMPIAYAQLAVATLIQSG